MIKDAMNKAIKMGEEKQPKQKYCFPNLGITVKAKSREEAERKVKDLINK